MNILLTIISFLLSFVLVVFTIPAIINVAKVKKLYEPFCDRKVHTETIPPMGGVAIFIAFVLSSVIATDGYSFHTLKYILASVLMMFFIGLKDDLLVISARKKFLVQLAAALLLIVLGNIHITDLHGILGFHQINYTGDLIITLFVILTITNAFNLIDGIDGLASGLALLATVVLGFWFLISGHAQFAIISFALAGSAAGFFLFNVFGTKNKLFMGDTGSLIIGLIVSVLVIKFNELNTIKTAQYAIGAAPSVSFAVVIVPLIDTLRVITIRLMQNRSPFSPDKNHIHHRLLLLVPSHRVVSAIIITSNAFIIGIALLFNHISFNINLQFLSIFFIGLILSFVPSILVRLKTPVQPQTAEIRKTIFLNRPEVYRQKTKEPFFSIFKN